MVEEQLKGVCRKLNEIEANVEMFSQMVSNGVATNDVRNFVVKQSNMKKSDNKYDLKLSKTAMRRKLNDACAQGSKLRRTKRELESLLITQHGYSKSKLRNLINRVRKQNTYHRTRHKTKTIHKYKHCEKKMKTVSRVINNKSIPRDVWEVLKNVELFNDDLDPQPPADPMICDVNIKLSPEEMDFLRRGPRFMLRQQTNLTDFQIELEKMIAKEKFGDREKEDEEYDSGISSGESDTEDSSCGDLEFLSDRVAAEAAMVYLKKEKRLDLSRLKATNYKFNKFVHLPRAQQATAEAKHEVRRVAMEKIFNESCNQLDKEKRMDGTENRCDSRKKKKAVKVERKSTGSNLSSKNSKKKPNDSNLTDREMRGLEKLKKRVIAGELVVTETDKSRRFCVLSPQQYVDSGMKHTSGDIRIDHDQLTSIQKTVNDHCLWMRRIFNIGSAWDHNERIDHSMTDKGEVVAPLRLLIKDHKSYSEEDDTPQGAIIFPTLW